jgi:hypothetical protein
VCRSRLLVLVVVDMAAERIVLDGLNPRAQPYKSTFSCYSTHASIHVNCLASVHINDNSTSRLTGYEPGVLPRARRDATASSGMLAGHQDPLWMFARLRGINSVIDDLRIMINAFPSEHSTSLETSNSCLYVVMPLLYVVLHYSVAPLQHFQPPTFASGYELPPRNFTQTSTIRSISAVLNRPVNLHYRQDFLQLLVKAEVQPFANSLSSDLHRLLRTDHFDWTHGRRTIDPSMGIDIIILGSRFIASAVEGLPIHPIINFNHCGLSNIWYNHHQHPPSTCNVSLHLPK